MTRFIFSTGHQDYIKPEDEARRFIAAPAKPPIHRRPLELPHLCDICGRQRSQGNHQRCSRRRQQLKRSEKR
ncbi:MAG TPA: hypothetical protein DEP32_13760 [Pseudomonas sp.]|nr:hypothetical protein [Pseudomonas sp.]MBB50286.1 hypothetical protein [Pseudomonadales bacterium]MBB50466.1 hypothetical protein [Pseudomonadales bacterium]HCA25227.1 hypothetical protein [Pseudomonas sp.]|tara:strand:- start:933 stop:1148 length:216 start_codon:yes stop_codon:yes gene_type:complete